MTPLRQTASQALAAPRPRVAVLVMGIALLLLAVALSGCLAEEGTGGSAGGPATWADVSQTFSGNFCTGCHNGSTATPSLQSTACTSLVNGAAPLGGTLIVPGDTATSVVYQTVIGNNDPSPPTNMTFSAQADVDTLASWINDGATCP